jgi:chromosome condensin MukBEF complex kleisin-like MukF subunit
MSADGLHSPEAQLTAARQAVAQAMEESFEDDGQGSPRLDYAQLERELNERDQIVSIRISEIVGSPKELLYKGMAEMVAQELLRRWHAGRLVLGRGERLAGAIGQE